MLTFLNKRVVRQYVALKPFCQVAENSAVTPDIFLAGFTFIREGRKPFLAFVVAMVVVITDFPGW